jgi:hypothetical protein
MVDSDRIDALGRALGVRVIIIVGECIDDLYFGELGYICSLSDLTSTRHSNKYKFPVKTGLNSAECQVRCCPILWHFQASIWHFRLVHTTHSTILWHLAVYI